MRLLREHTAELLFPGRVRWQLWAVLRTLLPPSGKIPWLVDLQRFTDLLIPPAIFLAFTRGVALSGVEWSPVCSS